MPVAIKDVFDTAELPTEYGSPIYAGHRPRADAALVGLLRAAGAVIVGKTKTCEFACMHPTDTRNPLDLDRTPGGSSSGSAAAVAARIVPLATGTQTAGSVVRPASYCGVLGFKPTFGVVPLAGALPTSASLDTVGLFARSVDDLELTLGAVSAAPAGMGRRPREPPVDGTGGASAADLDPDDPRIGVLRIGWDLIEPPRATRSTATSKRRPRRREQIEDAGCRSRSSASSRRSGRSSAAETAAALGGEADYAPASCVSPALRAFIDEGRGVSRDDYLAARRLADEQRWRFSESIERCDAVLAPSTLGVPPSGLESTGDPLLCRPFTLLGGPALALPGAWTADGLPIGVQLAGASHGDHSVLAVGAGCSRTSARARRRAEGARARLRQLARGERRRMRVESCDDRARESRVRRRSRQAPLRGAPSGRGGRRRRVRRV